MHARSYYSQIFFIHIIYLHLISFLTFNIIASLCFINFFNRACNSIFYLCFPLSPEKSLSGLHPDHPKSHYLSWSSVTPISNPSSVVNSLNSITKNTTKHTLITSMLPLINSNVPFHLNSEAKSNFDYNKMAGLTQTIKFNLGGHINHSIYWENLAPIGRGGG